MAQQHRIAETRDFPFPVERLFAHLAEHENMAALFAPAKVRRHRDGTTERNGIGSERTVRAWPLPAFVETITGYRENRFIEYRITRGGPLHDHVGMMRFTSLKAGRSRVTFEIRFRGRFPVIGAILASALRRGIRRGLKNLTL